MRPCVTDETVNTTGITRPANAAGGSIVIVEEVRLVMKVALLLTKESPTFWK